MKRVVIIGSQEGDWEILYIDGKEISQNHVLGEGNSRLYMLEQAKEYNFTIDDVNTFEATDEDEEMLSNCGRFPYLISDLIGKYSDI